MYVQRLMIRILEARSAGYRVAQFGDVPRTVRSTRLSTRVTATTLTNAVNPFAHTVTFFLTSIFTDRLCLRHCCLEFNRVNEHCSANPFNPSLPVVRG